MRPSRIKKFLISSSFLLFSLTNFACRPLPKKASELAPKELLEMPKTTVLEGEEAIQNVKKSHIGKVENIQDIAIVNYGPPQHQLVLWITIYPNRKTAELENEKMAEAMIKYGRSWDKNLITLTIEKRKIYRTSPDGREEHYFWAEKNCAFYVKIPEIFQGKFAEIIRELKK